MCDAPFRGLPAVRELFSGAICFIKLSHGDLSCRFVARNAAAISGICWADQPPPRAWIRPTLASSRRVWMDSAACWA